MKTEIVECLLCPHQCRLAPGERGDCRVRYNREGELHTLVYGKACSLNLDPIEKKPMFHFLPGTSILSVATAGCNLHCKFCQNWEISQANPEDLENQDFPPEKLVQRARSISAPSLAYTYSDPIIFYEYAYQAAALARENKIRNILVTAGYINEEPLRRLCKVVDGANIDLKGFTEKFYREVCSGTLKPVLRALEIAREEGITLEITNLIVPTLNDDYDQIRKMCVWIRDNLGPEIPLHFSRFFPMYKLKLLYPTPGSTLERAREIALEVGLHYVYIGNIAGSPGEKTICPGCSRVIIDRAGYRIGAVNLKNGRCAFCGREIYGTWS